MADVLRAYTELTSSTPRSQVSTVLQSIIHTPPFSFNQSSRAELIRLLLKDLKSLGPNSRLTNKDAAQALLAVKTLGKVTSGSQPLSEAGGLSTLLSLTTSLKDDPEASTQALRCIANTLLLFDHARATFISTEVGGGETSISMLDKATDPEQIFTVSRILFVLTVSRSSFIQTIVEDKRHGRTIVDTIVTKLDAIMVSILAGTKFAREAMEDLLKLAFNILLHYPKMIVTELSSQSNEEWDDPWSTKLESLLPPILRAYHTLPPTFPMPLTAPLTHIIHALITIPINTPLRPIWFGTIPPGGRTSTSSRTSSSRKSPTNASNSLVLDSPSESPDPKRSNTPIKPSTLDRTLSVISAGRKSLSRSPSPNPPSSYDVLQRTHDLLEVAFSHHFPGNSDPDSQEVRDAFKKETEAAGVPSDTSLDDILSPLVILCTRICLADESSRVRMREWTVPSDLDRTNPLDERPDFLGRCIRLLGSVYHTSLKEAVGEMLYAACDSDAALLSSLFGYGHVAGLLFNKGVMSAPSPPSNSSSSQTQSSTSNLDQREVNPITGTYAPSGSTASATADMTEEEKEQEMEKLFVLFDRLERSGSMPASQNPMRKIIEKSMSP
ncbi:guanine nucleotide exchange factor [Lentinula aciculospora]|uniref:Guanine nucleotide exchange factor n=1 Tax=Lentinula aciculospora TaxID=153920 RepID=A0A9W9ATM8_9AGAR|nr:guanine nucleotide exchange factor [Lentinula aciculospora]